MRIPSDITDLESIRQYLHAHPELGLKEFRTADFLSNILINMGLEVTGNIGTTGIVASLRRGKGDRAIGLRADMDGLPISESTQKSYTSRHENRMHACGHDGHMAILLGAAHALANDPDFKGTVHFIFQPAEENVGGAKLMIGDGLFQRFPCEMVFALHNLPGKPVGKFAIRDGCIAASIDVATITVKGKGGHGAQPEETVDPIVIGAHIVSAFQTVVSRNLGPFSPAVVTIGSFHSGSASNIIPERATLEMSLRATTAEDRQLMIQRLVELATSIANGFGGSVKFEWQAGYPVTINASKAVEVAQRAARQAGQQADPGIVDSDNLEWLDNPCMGSEDFSFMLEQVPGALMFIGNGESSPLHSEEYDFNDAVMPFGVQYLTNLARIIFDD
jgi:hippurate hydrolase